MFKNTWIVVAVVATGLLAGAAAPAVGQDKNWVGESVLHTKPTKDIKFADVLGGKPTYHPFTGRFPFKVRNEINGKLWLHDGQREGWVDKADFVLARDAFTFFDARVQANPKDSFALTMRAGYWLDKKDYEKAIKDFDACIQLYPNGATGYHSRGVAWLLHKDYDKAMADFGEALRLDPKKAVTFAARGVAWRNQKQYDKAIEDYDAALQIEPRFSNASYGRGAAWLAKKEYDKALKDFDQAIDVDPRFVAAFNDRGLAWVAKSEYAKGIKDYDTALHINPKNTVTFSNRAAALKTTRQYAKAIDDYEQAIRLEPKYIQALNGLGWILATCPEAPHRNGKRAVELATNACELTNFKEPTHVDVLAAAYAEAGDFAKAIQYERQALESARFEQQFGEQARQRLKLYEQKKAHRE